MLPNLRRYARVCLAAFFVAAFAGALSAQTKEQAIQNGLAYLRAQQNPDGSLGSDGLAGRDTAAAARALVSLDLQAGSTSQALIWIESHELDGTDPLARGIEALVASNQSPTEAIDQLASFVQSNSTGLGSFSGQQPDLLDTALAVRALSQVPGGDIKTLAYVVSFLKATQNADGGWGYTQGNASDLFVTANVTQALGTVKDALDVNNALNNALALLSTNMLGNGSVQDSPLVTAETVRAFGLAQRPLPSTATAPGDYLVSVQSPDGSWDEETFTTGEVLLALGHMGPDLVVRQSGILLSGSIFVPGETLAVTAQVQNVGTADAPGFQVGFYDGAPGSGTLLGEVAVPPLAAGANANVQFSWTVTGAAGTRKLYVVADPEGMVDPSNHANNSAYVVYTVRSLPDLTMASSEITTVPGQPSPGNPFQVEWTIHNLGESQALDVAVSVYNGNPVSGGILLGQASLGTISGGGSASGAVAATLNGGNYTIYVVADPANAIPESNESNNTASRNLVVGANTSIDFAIADSDITLTPPNASSGSNVTIQATVHNFGSENGTATVAFYDGIPGQGGVAIGTQDVSLTGGSGAPVSLTYLVQAATHVFTVVVDPENQIQETNEQNNVASATLSSDFPDLTLAEQDIRFSQQLPDQWYRINIYATVHNAGYSPASNINVEFYEGDPAAGGTKIGNTKVINSLAAQAQTEVASDRWLTGTAGRHRIYVVVDRTNLIVESNEDNNKASAYIDVWGTGSPDYYIAGIASNALVVAPSTLSVSGQVTVTVGNGGIGDSTAPFYVSVYEETVRDLQFDPLTEREFGRVQVTQNIPINGSIQVTVPVSGTASFAQSMITAMADSTHAVGEINEYNNSLPVAPSCPYTSGTKRVFGKSDLWLAGQPVGTCYAIIQQQDCVGTDSAPLQRAENSGLTLSPGQVLVVTATGSTSNVPWGPGYGPNGSYYPGGSALVTGIFGLSGLWTNAASLIGVFIGPGVPNPDPPTGPPQLLHPGHFMTPLVQQTFKIGAGPTTLVVPSGATRLFFGSSDSPGANNNNWGYFDVTMQVTSGANLIPSYLHSDASQYPDSVTLIVRLGNGGEGQVPAGAATVEFYDGDPADGGTLIGTVQNHAAILAGQFEEERMLWIGPGAGPHNVFIVANPGNTFQECSTSDNITSAQMTFAPAEAILPDLSISPADIVLVQPVPYANQPLDVLVTVRNLSSQDANNVAVGLFDGDPGNGGALIGTQSLSSLPGTSEAGLQFKWNTGGLAGIHFLHAVVDSNNVIEEGNEFNNAAFSQVELLSPALPDLAITDSDVVVTPASPMQGDSLQVAITVHNLGAPIADVPVSLYLNAPPPMGTLLGQQQVSTILQTGNSVVLTFTVSDPAMVSAYQFYGVVDPENTIQEINEENNVGYVPILIASAEWNVTLNTDQATYNPQQDVLVTVSVTNMSASSRDAQLSVVIYNDSNSPIAALATSDVQHFEANQTTPFSFTWNTGASFGGGYSARAVVVEQDLPRNQASASFSILAVPAITSSLMTDRPSYGSRRPVQIAAAVTNASVNYFYEGLTGHAEVLDPGGNVIATYDQTIGNLVPGAQSSFLEFWNTGTRPAGTYSATLAVNDGLGAVITGTSTTFVITGSGTQGLTGTLSVSPNPVPYPGDAILSYGVTNTGNADFSGTLHVKVVDPATSAVLSDFTAPLSLAMGSSVTGSFMQPGAGLKNQSYTAGLSAEDGNGTKPLVAAAFTVVDVVPPSVAITGPAAGICVSGAVTLAATATDDLTGVSSVEVKLDNQSVWSPMVQTSGDALSGTYSMAFTPQAADEGERTFQVRATDVAGNGEDALPGDTNPSISGFLVDVTAPMVTVVSPTEGSCAAPGFIPDILGSDTHGVTWTVTLNGIPYAVGTPITIEDLYTLEVLAADDCGNTSAPVFRHFTVDGTAPTVAIVSPEEGACAQPGIIPEIAGSDLTELIWTISLDGQPYTQGTPIEMAGDYTLEAFATDACGNTSIAATRHFSVDGTPPEVTVGSPAEGATVAPGFIPDIQGSDVHGVTWDIVLDGTPYALGTPIEIPGAHTLVVSASDGCGNASEPITRNFTVHDATPVLPSFVNRFAWFGCEWLVDNGNTKVAAVSSVGGTKVFGGHVGSNGPITVNGSNTINGNASPGPGATVTINGSQSQVAGSKAPLPAALACEEQSVADWVAYAQANQNNAAIPSQYLDGNGNFKLNGNKTCTLPAGIYYLSSFLANGNGKVIVSGPVVIVVNGFITINGNNKVNEGGDPANLVFVASSSAPVTLNGTAKESLKVYAPLSSIDLNGNVTGYGNLWGRTFTGNGSVVWNRLLDPNAPSLSITSPAAGSTISMPQPALALSYQDAPGGAGVNSASLQATMDGSDVTSALTAGPASATGQAPVALGPGVHEFEASVSDFDGNTAQTQSTFTVAGAGDALGPDMGILLKLFEGRGPSAESSGAGKAAEKAFHSLCGGTDSERLPGTEAPLVLEMANASGRSVRLRAEILTGAAATVTDIANGPAYSLEFEVPAKSVRRETLILLMPSDGSALPVRARVFLLAEGGESRAGEFYGTLNPTGLPAAEELTLALEDLAATLAEELTTEARASVIQALGLLEPLKPAWASSGPDQSSGALDRLTRACESLSCCPATNGCSAHIRISRLIRMATGANGKGVQL